MEPVMGIQKEILIGVKDYITISIALIGAILGVLNFWLSYNQRRVRLIVRSGHSIGVPDGSDLLHITVLNLSLFPVIVSEVGFQINGPINKGKRLAITEPGTLDGKKLPRKLDSRESASFYVDLRTAISFSQGKLERAYIRTSCDLTRYSDTLK